MLIFSVRSYLLRMTRYVLVERRYVLVERTIYSGQVPIHLEYSVEASRS